MTETAMPNGRTTESRLTAVETGLTHFREIQEMRQVHIEQAVASLRERNRQQDQSQEVMEERLLSKVDKLRQLIWSGLKWLAALLATATLTIVLKALSLI